MSEIQKQPACPHCTEAADENTNPAPLNECGCRRRDRSPEELKALLHRLNRIEGQIRGIRSMVESGAYCPDILVQAAAVNAAVNAFNKELLAAHIRTCVAEDIRAGRDETIDELVTTLQKLMK